VHKPTILYDGFFKLEAHEREGLPYQALVLRATDSVAGLLYDATGDRVLLVRQKRVPMERPDNPDGMMTELVAGRFDVKLGPKALLVKEAKEEAGVTLDERDVTLLNGGRPMALSSGILSERSYLAFAEISMDKVEAGERTFGLAEEGEAIGRVWMDAEAFISAAHDCVRVHALALHLALRRKEAGR
jgi:8-oxo-dGTP pyrophosphatase MutT (NUDIX family)